MSILRTPQSFGFLHIGPLVISGLGAPAPDNVTLMDTLPSTNTTASEI